MIDERGRDAGREGGGRESVVVAWWCERKDKKRTSNIKGKKK